MLVSLARDNLETRISWCQINGGASKTIVVYWWISVRPSLKSAYWVPIEWEGGYPPSIIQTVATAPPPQIAVFIYIQNIFISRSSHGGKGQKIWIWQVWTMIGGRYILILGLKTGFSKQMSALLMTIIFSHVADGAYVFSQRFARVHWPDWTAMHPGAFSYQLHIPIVIDRILAPTC